MYNNCNEYRSIIMTYDCFSNSIGGLSLGARDEILLDFKNIEIE